MKIILLIVIGIANCRNVSCAHNRLVSSVFQRPKTRHQLDVCSWQCDSASVEVSIKTDWVLDISTSTDAGSILISLGYNATLKIIGFINHKLKIAGALDGHTGFVGWFNLTSGAGIVINIKSGLAKPLIDKDAIKINNTDVVLVAFSKVITSQIQQLGTHSITNETFDLLAICDAIYNNYSYASIAEAYFKERKTLGTQIYTSFKIWFDLTRDLIVSGTITIDYGIVGFFGPIFGQPHTLFDALLKLLGSLYGTTSGQFNGLFTLAIYRILSGNIAIDEGDQVFTSLTFTIGAIGYFFSTLDSALSAYEGRYRLVSFEKKTGLNDSVIAHGRFVKDSWFVNLKTSSATVDVIVLYVKGVNAFAIYNRKLNVILVFSGASGLFGIWNSKTGEGIVVNYATGAAVVINSDSSILQSFSADAIIHACILIVAKINSYKSVGYSLLDKTTFLFGTYLLNAERSGVAFANVAVSSPVRAVVITSFKEFFEQLSHTKPAFGVLSVVCIAGGGVNIGWSLQIQEFITSVYTSKLDGRFDSRLFAAVYYEISVTSDVGSRKFLAKIISAVKNISSIDGGVSDAILGVLKANEVISDRLSGSVYLP